MRPSQSHRHQVGIVEVGQRRARVGDSCVQHGLCQWFEPRLIRDLGRQREGVVVDAHRILVVALEPTTNVARPCHVHGGCQQGEVSESRVRQQTELVARNRRRLQPADGRVFAPFRTDFGNHQKRRFGNNVDLPERRCVGQLQRGLALASLPKRANGGDPFPHMGQPRQYFGWRVVQRQNPALAALQVLARTNERSEPACRIRLSIQKRGAFDCVKDVVPTINRLRASEKLRQPIDRGAFLPDHQMRVRQPARVEQIR